MHNTFIWKAQIVPWSGSNVGDNFQSLKKEKNERAWTAALEFLEQFFYIVVGAMISRALSSL